MKVTNISKALQGVNTTNGPVYLKPGESREDLEFTEAEGRLLANNVHLSVDGKAPAKIDPAAPGSGGPGTGEDGDGVPDSTDRTSLKAKADELGIEYPRNIPTDKLNELVTAKLNEQK